MTVSLPLELKELPTTDLLEESNAVTATGKGTEKRRIPDPLTKNHHTSEYTLIALEED